jgi:hypothetical protein
MLLRADWLIYWRVDVPLLKDLCKVSCPPTRLALWLAPMDRISEWSNTQIIHFFCSVSYFATTFQEDLTMTIGLSCSQNSQKLGEEMGALLGGGFSQGYGGIIFQEDEVVALFSKKTKVITAI